MRTGEIYKWETAKAQGHEKRYKYHVFIGKNDQSRNVFLFINSLNPYNEDFELKNSDYPFFTKQSSYICCTNPVYYSDNQIAHLTDDDCIGILTEEHIISLHDHINKSEIMEQRLINFINACLKAKTS
tara:strand:- start:164 stop:547 length:384 start_codon:yes stop_codon:yes gene_type:complete